MSFYSNLFSTTIIGTTVTYIGYYIYTRDNNHGEKKMLNTIINITTDSLLEFAGVFLFYFI